MRYLLRILMDEYRAIFSDSGVLLIFVAGLTIYSMIYPVPYSPEVLKDVAVVPVDQDHSSLSRKLLRFIDATEEVALTEPAADPAEGQARILDNGPLGMVVIPEDFERTILRGEQAFISVFADAGNFLIFRQVATGALKAAGTLSAGVEIRRMTATGLGEKHAMAARDPIPLVSRPLFNPAGGYATYVVPAVLIIILQQTLLIGIGMLGGTRNEGSLVTFTPDGRRQSALAVLLARGFAYFSIYFFYPAYYVLVIFRIYAIPSEASVSTILLFLTPFVLAVTFLGLTLTTVFKTRELSIPALISTSLPAVFLVGFAWPRESIPQWLNNVALLLPSTSGCAGFVRLNQMGASMQEVAFEWATLWLLAGFYFILAWLVSLPGHANVPEQGAPSAG